MGENEGEGEGEGDLSDVLAIAKTFSNTRCVV